MDRIQLMEEYIQELTRFENIISDELDQSIQDFLAYVESKACTLLSDYRLNGNFINIKKIASESFSTVSEDFLHEYKNKTTSYLEYIFSIENLEEQKEVAAAYKNDINAISTTHLANLLGNGYYGFSDILKRQCSIQQNPSVESFKDELLEKINKELNENVYSQIHKFMMDNIQKKVDDYIVTLEELTKEQQENKSDSIEEIIINEESEYNMDIEQLEEQKRQLLGETNFTNEGLALNQIEDLASKFK